MKMKLYFDIYYLARIVKYISTRIIFVCTVSICIPFIIIVPIRLVRKIRFVMTTIPI